MATVLIIGAGAREHALAHTYLKSKHVKKVIVTPGNLGMVEKGIEIFPGTTLTDTESLLLAAKKLSPDLIDVAQDDALAAGTVDVLTKAGFVTFGPTRDAAQIEWDKEWSRAFMKKCGLPVPQHHTFLKGEKEALQYASDLLNSYDTIYFKAAGLCRGKGVIPVHNEQEAIEAYAAMQEMGLAGQHYLIEGGLEGEEFSYYAITDGEHIQYFKSAQDNKRINNDDQGPNTGGMGCNAPTLVTKGIEEALHVIMEKIIDGLHKEGRPYKGILYLGGIISGNKLGIVEFNARWGDPECHVILPGIKTDYYSLVHKAINGTLDEITLEEDNKTRVSIIGASKGYPVKIKKGRNVTIDEEHFPTGVHWLSAGIGVLNNVRVTTGGRVFSIVAEGKDVIEAKRKALQGMACCHIEDNGLHYRTDIAWRDIERMKR